MAYRASNDGRWGHAHALMPTRPAAEEQEHQRRRETDAQYAYAKESRAMWLRLEREDAACRKDEAQSEERRASTLRLARDDEARRRDEAQSKERRASTLCLACEDETRRF